MTEAIVLERKHLAEIERIPDALASQCKDICLTHMNQWKLILREELALKRVTGGLTNSLTKVSVVDSAKSRLPPGAPTEVLLRHFGEDTDTFFDRKIEGQIFEAFSDSGVGPKLLGTFEGGRIEQYLNAETLSTKDCPLYIEQISEKLAEIHNVQIPSVPSSPSLFNTLNSWLEAAMKVRFSPDDNPKYSLLHQIPFSQLQTEIEVLRSLLIPLQSPVVFCHNDFLAANLMKNFETGELHTIDYEYGNYNYRGYDIGNHFCEWIIDYQYEAHPKFKLRPENYPTQEQRTQFLTSYLKTLKRIQNKANSDPSPPSVTLSELSQLEKECDFFLMVPHFTWALWSIVQAGSSKISFGYMEYASERLSEYFRLKEILLAKYNNKLSL